MPSLDRAKQIIISRKYLRYLLSSSCVVLVAGVIHSSTLYSWAMSVIEPGNILVTVRQEGMPDITKTMAYYNKESKIPESMAAINGVFYSLLIASIFAPAFMVLRLKSEEAAIEATGEDHPGQVDEWISQNNLKIGLTEKLSTVVTALAPALVGGPALSLFELLFS